MKNSFTAAGISILCLTITTACSGQKGADKSEKAGNPAPQVSTAATAPDNNGAPANTGGSAGSATGCDASLWDHVYNPTRLQVLDKCMAVTGVIAESDADPDGDQHFLMTLDPGQDRLLMKKNAKKKGGNLVLEIVCVNPVQLKKARAACPGYTNHVPVPPVGAHVKVTGTFVNDTHNNWTEIHPVSKVETIK